MPVTRKECIRCGTCCHKGGPGLHVEDKQLVEFRVLEPGDLVCFRKGEFAFDQLGQRVAPLERELIKIRGKGGSWECCLYDPQAKGCRIYQNRPLECRTLMCWDTGPMEELMQRDDRLTRAHLVAEDSAMAQLIRLHEEQCGLDRVAALIREGDMQSAATRQELIDLCLYDLSFREVVVEQAGLQENLVECFLGRPLFRAVLGYDPWLGSHDFLRHFVPG